MTTIITIKLGGTIHTVDEEAFGALRRYLDQAGRRLQGNPDRVEILADLERSIADRLSQRAPAQPATMAEMLAILEAIGPVDPDIAQPASSSEAPEPRRLYRIHDGEMIAGVCTGLAAYADLDVNLVRVLFVVLTVLTGGVLALVYLVMMFVVPVAPASVSAGAPAAARP